MIKKQKYSNGQKLTLICIAMLSIYLIISYTIATGSLTPKERFENGVNYLKKNNPELLEEFSADKHNRPFESVGAIISKKYKTVKVTTNTQIKSKKDLLDYKNNRLILIDELIKKDGNKEVTSIINFKKSLTKEEYLKFVEKYNNDIELIEIRYRSSHQVNGKKGVTNDQPLPSKESIESIEKHMQEDRGFQNYKHITEILTIEAKIKAKNLKKIQNDPRVFLVDVGPIDIKELYELENNEVDMQWRYIFPEIERYGS